MGQAGGGLSNNHWKYCFFVPFSLRMKWGGTYLFCFSLNNQLGGASQVQLFFFPCNDANLIGPITQKKLKIWRFSKIEDSMEIWSASPFGGQNIWD
jgi:hypothetical protein